MNPFTFIDQAFMALEANKKTVSPDITNGIQGWWKLNDGSGSTAIDSSVNANNGTTVGSPSWVAGQNSTGALQFDGTSQYVTTTLANINYASGTVTFWAKPSTAYNVTPSMSKVFFAQSYSQNGFSGELFSDGNYYFGWNNIGDQRVAAAADSMNYINGSWNFYCFTWSASGSFLYVYNSNYPNGSLIGMNASTPTTANLGLSFEFGGAVGIAAAGYFPGVIDDFRIYNRVLSSGTTSEMTTLYNNGAH